MERWTSLAEIAPDFADTVVTIGKFDGVHLGHQRLLAESLNISEEHSLAAVVLTFDRHPDALLHPERVVQPITGARQKAELIEASGADALLTLPFDEQLASMTADDFVAKILVDALHARAVVVGRGFRFGAGGEGDVALLRLLGVELGFVVREVEPVLLGDCRISTTAVRGALDAGDIAKANAMLGRRHAVRGVIEHGKKLGRTIGFPTANMSRSAEGYLPLDAVYAGFLTVNHDEGSITYPAALSVGKNETFEAVPRVLEAFVLDRDDLDLYDLDVTIEFLSFVRPTLKFGSIEELISAIAADVEKVRLEIDRSVVL